jgi:hypothetical protein
MDQILCYSRSREFRALCSGLAGFQTIAVDTTPDLAAQLVEAQDVACVILHFKTLDDFSRRFLDSLRASFPLTSLVLIVETGEALGDPALPELTGDPAAAAVFDRLREHLGSLERKDKRKRRRFDWPLVGQLRIGATPVQSLRVRAISASGAFLEAPEPTPVPGCTGTIQIEFKDFSIFTSCEILSPRPAAGHLPAGFGVRFTDLTQASQKVLDDIIQDELVRSLMEPGSPPRAPAISP